ncbi:uncharacterized protein [Rutidosis leptorrhynchoides]|uniref:uncharacterized protein n=1 Tax=Rutidosis leptorrhynchoides TaxID=125765 RepID=UPI003A9A47CB
MAPKQLSGYAKRKRKIEDENMKKSQAETEKEHVETNKNEEDVIHNVVDISDPRRWEELNYDEIKLLIEKGPKRDNNIVSGPYTNERRKGQPRGGLDGEGYTDWGHASKNLRKHEITPLNETIDKVEYEQLVKERDYWMQVFLRIIAVVKFLAKYSLAFRGSKEKLYQKGNGNFLGLSEMLEEFDPIIKEHVRRITNDEVHVHYLGHKIQNELILMLGDEIKKQIIKEVKEAKYYSIILDCTPDLSNQEQMSMIVRYVKCTSNSVIVEESFLGFLNDMTMVKAIKTQLVNIREALLEVGEKDNDAAIASVANSIANKELGEFEILVSIVIWYQVLNEMNIVSKKLQSKDVHIEIAIKEINRLVEYFKDYRETGFSKAIDEAKEIAVKMDVDPVFPQKLLIQRKKRFDESSTSQEVSFTPEEIFRVQYFLYIVDKAILSLETRFEQFKNYDKLFGFLFPYNLRGIERKDLKSFSGNLENALKYEEKPISTVMNFIGS